MKMRDRVVGIELQRLLALRNHIVIPANKAFRHCRVHEHEQGIGVACAFHFAESFAFASLGGEKFRVPFCARRRNWARGRHDGQGRKSRRRRPPRVSCWIDLNRQRFDAVAEASELPDHSGGAYSLRPFAHGRAAFLVADPSVQNHPDQPTKAMGNCPDGLIVSQAWYEAAIHDLEDASFRPDRSVGTLIENAPHVAVALGGAVARGYSRALFISRARSHPGGQVLLRSKGRGFGTHFGNDLLRRSHS